ncbi:MAG: glutamate racemase [Caldilineales bacterium]|nr:glutamate racemase [Caldilineales bacterium]
MNHQSLAIFRPIGVFDSGVGGLSVWRALRELLPAESLLYLADQAHVPYGARPQSEIESLTHAAAGWMLDRDAKLIVIACNTASAAALPSLRLRWPDVIFVGMEPAVKPASERTRSGKVGVMATPGTLQADRFSSLVRRFATGIEVHTQICPGLVEAVEAGQLDGPQVESLLRACLQPLIDAGVDHLVLGCTHYPFLSPAIQRIVGPDVTLIDPAPAVARQTERRLHECDLLAPPAASPSLSFFTTGDPVALALAAERLLGLPQIHVDQAEIAT